MTFQVKTDLIELPSTYRLDWRLFYSLSKNTKCIALIKSCYNLVFCQITGLYIYIYIYILMKYP